MAEAVPCPCGSGRDLRHCCGPFLDGTAQAPTAEALMRSRYSAYSLGRAGYLAATWDPATRPQDLRIEPAVTWIGLAVLRVDGGGLDNDAGIVEFVARYKVGGRAHRLHEVSRFLRREGRWFYVDGDPGPTSR